MNIKAVLLLCAVFVTFNVAKAETKWELWNTNRVETRLKGPWYLTLEEELHWGDGISRFSYEHTDAELINKQLAWAHLSLGYQYVYQTNHDHWEREARPHLDATLLTKWAGFNLSNRSRFEYRIFSDKKDYLRYRNRTELKCPWHWSFLKISPVARYEYFTDIDQKSNDYFRLTGGLQFSLTKSLKAELYYFRQAGYERSYSSDLNVLGIKMNLAF